MVASADVDDESYSECHCEPQIFVALRCTVDVNPRRVELLIDKRAADIAIASFDSVLTQSGVTWNAESVLCVLCLRPRLC